MRTPKPPAEPKPTYRPQFHSAGARAAKGRPMVSFTISTEARDRLRAIADANGESMSAAVDRIILATPVR